MIDRHIWLRRLWPLLPLTLAAGCTTTAYVPPETSEPVAEVVLAGSPNITGGQTFYQEQCHPRRSFELGTQGMFWGNAKGPIRIAAGKRFTASGFAMWSTGFGQVLCWSMASWTPESGRTYQLTQVRGGGACHLLVVDAATGAASASYREEGRIPDCGS
jgi:hypothetical protein